MEQFVSDFFCEKAQMCIGALNNCMFNILLKHLKEVCKKLHIFIYFDIKLFYLFGIIMFLIIGNYLSMTQRLIMKYV